MIALIIVVVIAVLVFFVSRWILNRWSIGMKKRRTRRSVLISILVGPSFYFIVIISFLLSAAYYPRKSFSSDDWQSFPLERYKMSRSLIKNQILIDKTKEEVLMLLGSDYISISDTVIVYEIGHVPGPFNIDPSVIELELKNGKVINVIQYEG